STLQSHPITTRAHPCAINPTQLRALHPKHKPDRGCHWGPCPEKEGATLWAPKQTEVKSQAHQPSQR
ncbi:hypothetical protein M9458_049967, partial [Cirrhinus mrigala]